MAGVPPPSFQSTWYKPEVRRLTAKDVSKAAETLLQAFERDALSNFLTVHIQDWRERKLCELYLYEAYIQQHIAKGLVFGQGETPSGFETISIWSHPESEEQGLNSFNNLMEAGYGKVWNMFGPEGRKKVFYGMLPLLHDSCERIINGDLRFKGKGVYTLVYVGSTPDARGKGNLRKLFDFMFENYIDKNQGNLTYLESSSIKNLPIYEKFGFHLVEDIYLGNKFEGAVEGKDYVVMNIMVRGIHGHNWTKDKSKL
ncbi:hypothetical protein KGF56_004735 [Candida oxycetoniae]|uniref:N-acetyltransferase domain-containing protein n=1 Tax=Candida oxycetoniae TaxID=497107 RepID=A0AAI9WVR0_9ASCO|nr:uncharacterized protein KGF56_004735 [Candida oxycetoniae]KAI3402494.2 hypothetical protein KGF56_004735 [Candida oxycetoniae]